MIKYILSIGILVGAFWAVQGQHPCLSLTEQGVERIKSGLGSVPLFDKELVRVQQEVDAQLALRIIKVPVPKDMAGGYTHEQHKYNYKLMYKAGNLYQISGDERYAVLVKELLLAYAEMYPTLGLHPTMNSYATGKIFWQCLNDANWLVFTSQAYDCIYDFLSPEERALLETQLFVPFANFLSTENPKFFNRIHNHSTWANAAVGMIALVMDNDTLLQKALYGLSDDGIDPAAVDNDGGYIKKNGVRVAGFLAQLDYSFSTDGYFAEGPYYLRYAIFPFLKFGQALHHKKPDLDIFNYRDGILKKATQTLLELTNSQGQFFPINDAQKGMSFHTYELVTAVDLMYSVEPENTALLNWAKAQGRVALDESGFVTARALTNWEATSPQKVSAIYGDGVNGDEGGVAVVRLQGMEALFKFSTQGMGHGHFDRLSYSLYDEAGEIVQDYGAVRWVNIDQKAGGRYLLENKTFGKQTVGHNALVVNNRSHFGGSVKKAEEAHPDLYAYDFSNPNHQLVSAVDAHAYANASMHRTLVMIADEALSGPVLLDIMRIQSTDTVALDLPFWYMGDYMKNSVSCSKALGSLEPLGAAHGYQHIWKESSCPIPDSLLQFNWFGNNRFYTLHAVANAGDSLVMGRLGANDPKYNLRPDPVLIHRRAGVQNSTLVHLVESHGEYSRVTEIPINPYAQVKFLDLLFEDEDYVIVSLGTDTREWILQLSLSDASSEKIHQVRCADEVYKWKGIYNLIKSN